MRRHRSFATRACLALVLVSLAAIAQRLSGLHAAVRAAVDLPTHTPHVPVVVELFTSEGCSTCPHADALLARLDREQPIPNADILILGEHVDYWDGLGWKDRFSSSELTERQRDYQTFFHTEDIYTPQTVVQGSAQFNGTDAAKIVRALTAAAATSPLPLHLNSVQVHGSAVTFSLQDAPETPGYVNVYAALVDPADNTRVLAGENSGRTLAHAGVVRVLARVGSSYRTKALGERPFAVQVHLPQPPMGFAGMRLVVFVQTKHIGPILGAAACTLGPSGAAAPYESCPVSPPGT